MTYTSIEYLRRAPNARSAKYVVPEREASEIDRLLEQHGDRIGGGRSRPVRVWGEIDQGAYATHRRKFRRAVARVQETYESAMAASRALGYDWPAVGQALARAKASRLDVGVVAGVPFRHDDEIEGAD